MQAQTNSLEEDLIDLSKSSPDPNCWSIFKVPYRLRQVNQKAYEPEVISIGPYYNGKEHLRVMQIIKERCLSRIMGESMGRANEFVRAMKEMEEDVRKCYAEGLDHIDSDAFVKMMIVDGCFIIDLLQNKNPIKYFSDVKRSSSDLFCDLLLLENQLPFSVLSKLYGIIKNESNAELTDEFARLALSTLSQLMPGRVICPEKIFGNIKHLLGLVHDCWIPRDAEGQGQGTSSKFIRCATELEEVGIKFVNKYGSSLFDIEFTDTKLKIPTLHIHDNTERILRNFVAYEQFIGIWEPGYVSDYMAFMGNLMGLGKDVQLLRRSGVIVNLLGDDEAVAQMFNKLRDFTYPPQHSFYSKKIYEKVDMHCRRRWNIWMAILRRDYINNPSSMLNFSSGLAVGLLLTLVQTIFSVLSYVHNQ